MAFSFAGITSSVLAANTVPVFCSRMRQDIRKISTALEAGTATCPEDSFSLLLLLSKPTFVSISAKQQKFGRPLTETCYRTVGAVAETSWRALSSWKLDLIFLMFPGVPHACCFAWLLFFFFSAELIPGITWCSWSRPNFRHARVNHWNERGHAIVSQIFPLSKSSESARPKGSQVEKVEEPTLSQRYLIYSLVPLKWIIHLQIRVFVLYCLHL